MTVRLLTLLALLAPAPALAQPEEPPIDADAMRRAMGQGPPLATQRPSDRVPAGAIEVKVVDENGQPAPRAVVELAIMDTAGGRSRRESRTGPDGVVTIRGLGTGTAQSYRVNVPHDGAKYSSTPFQLPPDRGYEVIIRRLPTTREARTVLQFLGRVHLEFIEDRLRIVQVAVLMNPSDRTYVFPDDGMQVQLPEGFANFQSQDVMTDQRFTPNEPGFLLHGSVPPGQLQLVWAYDFEIDGRDASFTVPVPWRTMQFEVAAEASEEMRVRVRGMPDPEVRHHEGRRLLVTGVARRPGDPPLGPVSISIGGIPGPGPWRWLAIGGTVVLFLSGLLFLVFPGSRSAVQAARARKIRRGQLLAEVADLERMFAASEIGPKFRGRRAEEIVTELASLLRQDAAARTDQKRELPPR